MYDIANSAAGASWMFKDRGERMLEAGDVEVKSALDIFVKDLNIVHTEANTLHSPIPIASSALQQFVSGQALGLGKKDDSQVVKVYENITSVAVGRDKMVASGSVNKLEGTEVGQYWMVGGQLEKILEVGEEPRHFIVLSNEYVRALRGTSGVMFARLLLPTQHLLIFHSLPFIINTVVSFPPNDTTWAHRHAEDSLYFFLVEDGLDVVNHVQGSDPGKQVFLNDSIGRFIYTEATILTHLLHPHSLRLHGVRRS